MKREQIMPPSYGEVWEGQGGIVVDFVPSMNGQPGWYLILPTDPKAEKAELAWGPRDFEVKGAQSDWDGLANTKAMLASGKKHPAAEFVAGLVIDGHSDFYLPSRREMRLLWARVPERFEARWHWSSTQFSRHYAWLQIFGGGQSDVVKGYEARVRAVRRFTLSA